MSPATPTLRDAAAPRPWYRQLWPWLLMLPPLASVAGGSTILYLAVHSPADLVVSDYSRIEAITDERFARDARAAELGLAASLEATRARGAGVAVAVRLHGAAPAWLRLVLQHVALRDADVELRLVRAADGSGRYEGEAELARGEYELELLPPDDAWRLAGRLARVPAALDLAAERGAER